MARENLPTNYVNYELATAMGGMRRFNQISNSDGTISFEDATTYSVTGTTYGASEINTANALINEINELVGTTSISGSGQTDITSLLGGTDISKSTLGLGDGTVTGAISKLTSNLADIGSAKSGITLKLTHTSSGTTGTATNAACYRISQNLALIIGTVGVTATTSTNTNACSLAVTGGTLVNAVINAWVGGDTSCYLMYNGAVNDFYIHSSSTGSRTFYARIFGIIVI